MLASTADLQWLTQHTTAVHFLMARLGINEAEQLKEVAEGRKEFNEKLQVLQAASLKTRPSKPVATVGAAVAADGQCPGADRATMPKPWKHQHHQRAPAGGVHLSLYTCTESALKA